MTRVQYVVKNVRYSLIFLFFYFSPSPSLFAQFSLRQSQSIPVTEGADSLILAWSGGLNFCQFSNIDLNHDGLLDLFIFDRSGNRILPLLYHSSLDSGYYSFASEYINDFPHLKNWVLLRDFNGDGLQDIFTNYNEGISVYLQKKEGKRFELVIHKVSTIREGETAVLGVSARDIPAIIDVDKDGDIDILTFDSGGSKVEYHQNRSMELFSHSDSLVFELVDKCWGNFQENSISNDVLLDAVCESRENNGHAGSTLLSLDLNGDDLLDLVLGDISFSNMVALINGGSVEDAKMVSQNRNFPTSFPINLPIFPAAFHLDIDKDGLKDLVVSPNGQNVSENTRSIWWYKNTSTNQSPSFELQTQSLFQDQMLDFGEGAYPVAFDENGDGLMDLVLGNYGYYDGSDFPNINYQGRLALLRNIGNTNEPVFELANRDWANISQFNLGVGLYPTFADIDGNRNKDMLIGTANGQIVHFEREGENWMLKEEQFQNIDVGDFATPQLIDINRDGLVDLVVGERSGNLNYFENKGTPELPSLMLTSEKWGNVAVSEAFIPGYSVPHIFEYEGKYQLLVGAEKGTFFYYKDIEENILDSFRLTDSTFENINLGIRSAASFYDWNDDGLFDLIGGNYAGGLSFWFGEEPLNHPEGMEEASISIFPNPFEDRISIIWEENNLGGKIFIRNLGGQILFSEKIGKDRHSELYLKELPKGVYVMEVWGNDKVFRYKLVK